MKLFLKIGLLVVIICGLTGVSDGQVKVGAIGDSLLDEHFDQSGFGTNLGYSQNAFELLVTTGRIDAGPTGNWGGTRNDGYEYNWALAGSTTGTLLDNDQHTNFANQINSVGITKAVMVVGSNDLFPFFPTFDGSDPDSVGSSYENVYEGFASDAVVTAIANQAVINVVTAVNTLKSTGVDLIIATAPEYGIARYTKTFYPDPVKRERVDDVYELYNSLAVEELTNNGTPVVDLYRLTKEIWGQNGSENTVFNVGGVDIQLNGTGGVDYNDVLMGNAFTPTSDTTDAFTHDGIHPNTLINGVFANLFMTAFNQEYGDSFVLFTEEEILQNAGPNTGGMYTDDTLINSLNGQTYSDFIFSAVPEPNSILCLGLVGIGGLLRRRRGAAW